MKIQTKILAMALLSLTTINAFADGCSIKGYQSSATSYNGKTDCSNVTLSSLDVNGKLTADKTTVNGDTNINGHVHANFFTVKGTLNIHGETFVNSLTVMGSSTFDGKTTLSSSKLQATAVNGKLLVTNSIFGNTQVNGTVNIQDSKINGDLTLASHYSTLNGTVVNNVTFTNDESSKPQILCLEKASHVEGNITFKSGNGTVYTVGASKIDGKVTGAKVINASCPDKGEVSIN